MTRIDFKSVESILSAAHADKRTTLLEYEVYRILQAVGISAPNSILISDIDEMRSRLDQIQTEKRVIKVASTQFLHKTDIGGIQFAPRCQHACEAACQKVWSAVKKAGADPKSVQLMISEFIPYSAKFGRELLVSFRVDPSFGPIVNFGLGGVQTEFFGKNLKPGRSLALRSTRNLSRDAIHDMIRQTAIYDILVGAARGQKKVLVNIEELIDLLQKLSRLAEHFSPLNPDTRFSFSEFEVNPLAISDHGRLIALDGLARFYDEKADLTPRPVHKIKQLLEPRSALVVGASGKGMNPGRIILRNLISGRGVPKEKIYILRPQKGADNEEIDGCRCISDLKELPDPVDMAVVTVPASPRTVDLIRKMIESEKIASITLITSGFGETAVGKKLNEELEEVIQKGRLQENKGAVVNGPNCLGIVSLPGKYNTFFIPKYKLPPARGPISNVASISQSGAYLVAQTSNIGHFLSPRYAISFGNQIDLTVSDFLEYLIQDHDTHVFCIYIEGLKPFDGRRFLEQATRAKNLGKKVVVYKNGRTEAGAKAAASHTASIAGDFEVLRQLFAQAGVLLANDLDEFEDMTKTFSALASKRFYGNRLGIITNAGFEATTASDSIGSLRLASFSEKTVAALQEKLPQGIIDFRNPVDTSPIADTNAFLTTVEAMLEDPEVDCAVVSAVPITGALNTLPAGERHREDIERETSFPQRLIRAIKNSDKPVVVAIDSGHLYDPCARKIEAAGIPTFRRIDRAVKALALYLDSFS
ncbi:MAG: hypothetical protein B6244_09240 [Candidatus Cloacimonetes bacterium 4572_55]|nr:MAG: hypothetical protein B6244_09240 [Candidatus Cloacimonetes bacterium 4572_55]